MKHHAPPPTKFGAPATAQSWPDGRRPGGSPPPPPTRFAPTAALQPLRPAAPANPAPPPAKVGPPAPARPSLPAAAAARPAAPPPTRFASAPTPRPAGTGPGAIQRYTILSGQYIYDREPASRPWGSYPYAVVTGAHLQAQQRPVGTDEAGFLNPENANQARVTPQLGGVRLRLSDDARMAIEDSDLQQRQPKVFFLTAELLASSNRDLELAQSNVRLRRSGGSIRILTGWWSTNILVAVTAEYQGHASPDQLPQNCNLIAEQVTGRRSMETLGINAVNAAKIRVFGESEDLSEEMVRDYVTRFGRADMRKSPTLATARANQFANPGIGDAYMIATIRPTNDLERYIAGSPNFNSMTKEERDKYLALEARLPELQERYGGAQADVYDFESREERRLGWSYHFAGVVARSGNDCVTLENYARGDLRTEKPDPRWYFQMYSQSKSGQSFHEAHKAQNAYANPLTVTVSG